MPSREFTEFASGYIVRALGQLPRQGSRAPWRISPTYRADVKLLRSGAPVDVPGAAASNRCGEAVAIVSSCSRGDVGYRPCALSLASSRG